MEFLKPRTNRHVPWIVGKKRNLCLQAIVPTYVIGILPYNINAPGGYNGLIQGGNQALFWTA